MTTPEFSRTERVDTIGEVPRTVHITAEPGERAALAERFALIAIEELRADFTVQRDEIGIVTRGRIIAHVTQPCVVTGEPVPARIDESVALRFVDDDDEPARDEIELTADALDIIPYENGEIDLGEAAAETMALALEPFPRSADAEATLRASGVLQEDQVGPFSALAALKAKLGGSPS